MPSMGRDSPYYGLQQRQASAIGFDLRVEEATEVRYQRLQTRIRGEDVINGKQSRRV